MSRIGGFRAVARPPFAAAAAARRLLKRPAMKLTSALLSLLVLVGGCGTAIKTTTLNASPRPMQPRPPETVELYTSGAPARGHVDVALIEAEEQSSLSVADTGDMLRKLRAKGGQMGCDAVVVGGSSSRDPGLRDAETWIAEDPKGRRGFYATCIMYNAPPARP